MSRNQKKKEAFVLIEALAAVVIASICLTLIAQSLLSNFRSTTHFQKGVRALLVMENQLEEVYQGPPALLGVSTPLSNEAADFSVRTDVVTMNDHLKGATIRLSWPVGILRRTFRRSNHYL